jgi:uncharacterized Zn finger protein
MAAAKINRLTAPADTSSVDSLLWNYAEALYKKAVFSTDSIAVASCIDRLSDLKERPDDSLAETIRAYMTELEARKK